MNQSRIWLVVKPTVGLPLFLGTVLIIALLVHWAVLNNTAWFPAYWNGKAGQAAVVIAPAAPPAPVLAAPQPAEALPAGKVYFDPDKSGKWVEGGETIDAVGAYLKAHESAKASISGYHDPSGDLHHNMELSKARAFAVRDALVAAGVSADRLMMEKPMQTTGSANVARDGRRVDITITP